MDAETVGKLTFESLQRRGYVFWRCSLLNGDTIAIVKNGGFWKDKAADRARELIKSGKLHEMPAIYTEDELIIMANSDRPKFVHDAKKLGAEIETEGDI